VKNKGLVLLLLKRLYYLLVVRFSGADNFVSMCRCSPCSKCCNRQTSNGDASASDQRLLSVISDGPHVNSGGGDSRNVADNNSTVSGNPSGDTAEVAEAGGSPADSPVAANMMTLVAVGNPVGPSNPSGAGDGTGNPSGQTDQSNAGDGVGNSHGPSNPSGAGDGTGNPSGPTDQSSAGGMGNSPGPSNLSSSADDAGNSSSTRETSFNFAANSPDQTVASPHLINSAGISGVDTSASNRAQEISAVSCLLGNSGRISETGIADDCPDVPCSPSGTAECRDIGSTVPESVNHAAEASES